MRGRFANSAWAGCYRAGPAPPGRRGPGPALRASEQNPALPLGVCESPGFPVSALLILSPAGIRTPGRNSNRRGTPAKDGRDEPRRHPHGYRPVRWQRLSTSAPLRSTAHAPARRRAGRADGGTGRQLHRQYCANSPVGACAHGPAPGSRLPIPSFLPSPPPSGNDGGQWRGNGPATSERRWGWAGLRGAARVRSGCRGPAPRRPRSGSMSAASKAVALGGFWWTPALWGAPCPRAAVRPKWQRDCLCSGTNGWLHICTEEPFQVSSL